MEAATNFPCKLGTVQRLPLAHMQLRNYVLYRPSCPLMARPGLGSLPTWGMRIHTAFLLDCTRTPNANATHMHTLMCTPIICIYWPSRRERGYGSCRLLVHVLAASCLDCVFFVPQLAYWPPGQNAHLVYRSSNQLIDQFTNQSILNRLIHQARAKSIHPTVNLSIRIQ